MLIAVNYHYIRPAFDAPYPGIHGITPAAFESQLKLLAGMGTFVSGAEIRDTVRGEHALPERALVVTFDDGLREQHEHAVPVLRRLGIPAIFFINTRPVEASTVSSVHKIHQLRSQVPAHEFGERLQAAAKARDIALDINGSDQRAIEHYKYDDPAAARLKFLLNFALTPSDRDALVDRLFDDAFAGREAAISRQLYMTRQQLAELAECDWIGTHGHEHLPLGLLAADEAAEQIRRSSELLEAWTGRRPFALSYPYGSREASSPAVAAVAARHGIEFAFTMERAANRDLSVPLQLARFDNNDLPGGKACRWQRDEFFAAVEARRWHLN